MKSNYWIIDGENQIFDTLHDVKHHIWIAFTPKERVKYLSNTQILHYKNDELFSAVDIIILDGGEHWRFGRPLRQQILNCKNK